VESKWKPHSGPGWTAFHGGNDGAQSPRPSVATVLECDLLYLACLVALVLTGSGPFSIDDVFSRKH
jgi:uncharacterized membrane protein YphA (DoxX/SURF4 family)